MKRTILFFTIFQGVFAMVSGQSIDYRKHASNENDIKNYYRLDSLVQYGLDIDKNTWDLPQLKQVYEYNDSNQVVSSELWNWDLAENEYKPASKETNEYDADGLLSETTWYIPNTEGGWITSQRESYQFSATGLLEETNRYAYDIISSWMFVEKNKYQYKDGHIDNKVMYLPGLNTGDELTRFMTYIYSFRGPYISTTSVFRHDRDGDKEVYHTSYNYDYFDKMFIERNWIYNEDSSKLVMDLVKGYNYDDNDHLTTITTINYVNGRPDSKMRSDNYHFNLDITKEKLLLPKLDDREVKAFHHMVMDKNISIYNSNTERYDKTGEVKYYYTTLKDHQPEKNITDIPIINESIKLYPNPTSGSIMFELPTGNIFNIKIINNMGVEVFNSTIENNSIDIRRLTTGIYYYEIEGGNRFKAGRIIKE